MWMTEGSRQNLHPPPPHTLAWNLPNSLKFSGPMSSSLERKGVPLTISEILSSSQIFMIFWFGSNSPKGKKKKKSNSCPSAKQRCPKHSFFFNLQILKLLLLFLLLPSCVTLSKSFNLCTCKMGVRIGSPHRSAMIMTQVNIYKVLKSSARHKVSTQEMTRYFLLF